MCRLLYIRDQSNFAPEQYLRVFAESCKNSKEYQGHGWGISLWQKGEWQHYHNITPIWEDDLAQFSDTTQILVHARSAFRDQDICVENNMPFPRGNIAFAFNGELQGVRIREAGRIGAEKIFNFILRFIDEGLELALRKGVENIRKRSRYIRAMNIIMVDGERAFVSSEYGEDPEYFNLYYSETDQIVVCSEPLSIIDRWNTMPNQSERTF